jgi:signal transduction histidine kinase
MLIAGVLWWLLADTHRQSSSPRPGSAVTATRRLAELYANAAFRAVITSDYAALNELIRRSSAWPEVAYVAVEDTQGKVVAHTDPAKVGRVWNPRLAAEVRAASKVSFEEVVVPLVDAAAAKNGARIGQLRLAYVVGPETTASGRTGGRVPLSLVLACAAIAAIPIALVAESVGGRRRIPEQRPLIRESSGIPEKVQRLAEQLREARAETQRARAELAERTEDLVKASNERDQHLSEVEVLRNSIDHYVVELHKLRADAALVEAGLSPARSSTLAPEVAPSAAPRTHNGLELKTQDGLELKELQARMMTQVAQACRSSLTNILGYSKLLMRGVDGELSPAQKANVTSILDAGTRLVGLVNGVSEYLRVESAMKEPRPATVDLGAVVNTVLAGAPDPEGRLVSIPPGAPLAVTADPGHLEHILRALVVDAMSLDPEAKGRLRATPTDDRVVLELALTDFHLAPEEVRGVLDPFAGIDVSRPLDETRVRLAVARGLAEVNGGQLSIDARGPEEVIFELELQAAAAVAS